MRFVILVAGATAAGALSAVKALGGNLADFKISDINPAKAYRDVVAKITSGEPQLVLPAAPPIEVRGLGPDDLKPVKIDDKAIKRAIAAGISSQVDQNIRRMQDLQAYGRNPMGWHGAPPH